MRNEGKCRHYIVGDNDRVDTERGGLWEWWTLKH